MKYSDYVAETLSQLGYEQCFYVGGGNIMHLIESLSNRMKCTAVIHEVAAGIAAEYYNATSGGGRALALVTAGPGLTNIVTAFAGAFLESRELLVIGGQVKTADLARGKLRQRGIQEIDGVSIVAPISVRSVLVDEPIAGSELAEIVSASWTGRKGPVFIEMPLDVQARDTSFPPVSASAQAGVAAPTASAAEIERVAARVRDAKRPVLLLGGGVSREAAHQLNDRLADAGVPVATTWNGMDRIGSDHPAYVGRPNTWGQRSANIVIQQADLLIAVGTRLGLQQTGFNWQAFIPNGEVVQIDLDRAELEKGHPRVATTICADGNDFLARLLTADLGDHGEWLAFAREVRSSVPLIEPINKTGPGFVSPHRLIDRLSDLSDERDVVIPCSSGGAFTVTMQTFRQKLGQRIVTNKGLASMGYGLSGAIGAAIANPDKRTILIEGDGGFAQNLQEIGTAAINNLNLKMFVFDDSGYASIRMTQRNYFNGKYLGCDINTGLGLPNWTKIFQAWDVPVMTLDADSAEGPDFVAMLDAPGPAAFVVKIDPEQTYFPKIASRITAEGSMESNPLHIMSPELPADLMNRVFRN